MAITILVGTTTEAVHSHATRDMVTIVAADAVLTGGATGTTTIATVSMGATMVTAGMAMTTTIDVLVELLDFRFVE